MYRFLQYGTQSFMTRAVRTVPPGTTLRELDVLFRELDFNFFPVVDDGLMVGAVTKFDFLKAFAFTTDRILPPYEELMRRTVADVMSRDVISVEPRTPLTRVLELMVAHRARSLPVLDEDGALVGVISRQDLVRALDEATQASSCSPRRAVPAGHGDAASGGTDGEGTPKGDPS